MSTGIEVPISKITNKQLNWVIAQLNSPSLTVNEFLEEHQSGVWNHLYVEDPRHGGFLLDLYKIETTMHRAMKDGVPSVWSAIKPGSKHGSLCVGSTRLEAGLKCLAREIYGEAIRIPTELLINTGEDISSPQLYQQESQQSPKMAMRN